MLNRLRKFGLTKQDTALIGFLLVTFIAGLIVKVSGWNNRDRMSFDYSKKDRDFEQQVSSAFTELKQSSLTTDQEVKLRELESISDSLTALKETEKSPNKPLLNLEKKININQAYSTDLEILPGVGAVTAERIIEYREKSGGFKKIEDIMKVKGIGQKKFEKIKDYITVE
jgi:competence ComEA-like helix-hairpin-helix protein